MKNSISIYIHIPYCISKCDYCDFFSVVCRNCHEQNECLVPDAYVDSLCNEIKYKIKSNNFTVCNSIYIGGGTPSLLTSLQLNKITEVIKTNIALAENYEFTIESNPDDISQDLLKNYASLGVTRISCGFQSLNDKVLKNVNRRAGRNENIKALEIIRDYWKGDFSADMISGLPFESEESFFEGLNTLISFNPDHISLYSLTIEEETVLGQKIEKSQIEYDYDFADEMWLKGRDLLEKHSYGQYEVSNFCKPDKECKHNLVYWNHDNYIGCGCGAAGSLYKEDGTGIRTFNLNNLPSYIKFWADGEYKSIPDFIEAKEVIDKETSVFEFFMMGLRKLSGVSTDEFCKTFNLPFPEKVMNQFKRWQENKLAEIKVLDNDTVFKLNHEGILFLNKFLEEIEI